MKVNKHFFADIFNPFMGSADIDEEYQRFKDIDLENDYDVQNIIDNILKPYFTQQNELYKLNLKRSLSYHLTTLSFSLEEIIHSFLLPFELPNDKGLYFFSSVWYSYFGDEEYLIKDTSDIIIVNNLNEFNRIINQ